MNFFPTFDPITIIKNYTHQYASFAVEILIFVFCLLIIFNWAKAFYVKEAEALSNNNFFVGVASIIVLVLGFKWFF